MLSTIQLNDDVLRSKVTDNGTLTLVPNDSGQHKPLHLPLLQDTEHDIMTFSSDYLPYSILFSPREGNLY